MIEEKTNEVKILNSNEIYCIRINKNFQEMTSWRITQESAKNISKEKSDIWNEFSIILFRLFYLREDIVLKNDEKEEYVIYYTTLKDNEVDKDLMIRVLNYHRKVFKDIKIYNCILDFRTKIIQIQSKKNITDCDNETLYNIYTNPAIFYYKDDLQCSFSFVSDYFELSVERIFDRLKKYFTLILKEN